MQSVVDRNVVMRRITVLRFGRYERTTLDCLMESFTPSDPVRKVANLVLCYIAPVLFPDDEPLKIETCRNIPCDIIYK